MTLQEAIIHAKEKSKTLSGKCAQEHLQLAEWLEELQCLRKSNNWIPVSERLPEEGSYVLLSFENFTIPDIGRYETDEEGGAFYPGDDDESYVTYGILVNAWRPLPEPYKRG